MKAGITKKQAKGYSYLIQFPKVNSAKLEAGNNLGVAPIIDYGKGCFGIEENWELLGWSTPPYKGSNPHALVLTKVENNDNLFMDMWRHCELGVIYWVHVNALTMKFKLPNKT